jgi:SAM-dependent methyltransferase
MSIEIVSSTDALDVLLLKDNDNLPSQEGGWNFLNGDPEYWVFKDRLVKPGGKVFDFGIGATRSSLFFALNGMTVEGCDKDPESKEIVDAIRDATGLPISSQTESFEKLELPENEYDLVVISGVIMHLASTKEALSLVEKAYKTLKPGGHIYIRTVSREDAVFEWSKKRAESFPFIRVTDELYKYGDLLDSDPLIDLLYVDPTVFMQFLLQRGAQIVHSEVMPTLGIKNIMFGENWNGSVSDGKNGMVTLIAQK